MEIILLEKIKRLGNIGDVVEVKNGYARNFLLPRNKALRASKENLAVFEKKRATIEADNAKNKAEAEKIAKNLEGKVYNVIRQAGEKGQLFGSVRAKDVADEIAKTKQNVNRQQIEILQAVKTIGLFKVAVHLHSEVHASVLVNVARSEDEAEYQAANPDKFMGGVSLDTNAQIGDVANDDKSAKAKAAKAEAEDAEGDEVDAAADKPAKKPRAKKAKAEDSEDADNSDE